MIELGAVSADDWTIWRELRLAALAEAPYAYSSRLVDWQGEGDRAAAFYRRNGFHRTEDPVGLMPDGGTQGVPHGEIGVRPAG